MSNLICSWEEARKKLLSGMEIVSKIVWQSFWPKWRNVVLARGLSSPIISNDGVTIAKEINLPDPIENVWAAMIIEAAEKTNTEVGDGTTTTTILAHAICKEGMKYISSGVNPFKLADGLHAAEKFMIEIMKAGSKKISSYEDIEQVASLSAQDEEVGKIIAECFDEVGNEGIVTVEEGMLPGLVKEIKSGMQFDQGFVSPFFITDQEKGEVMMENARVMVTDRKITSMKDIVRILEYVDGKPLLLIADDIDGECLASLILNKMRWAINVLPVKLPWLGIQKREMMFDIAVTCGAIIISDESASKRDTLNPEDYLGDVAKVMSTKNSTTIIAKEEERKNIEDRAAVVRQDVINSEGPLKTMHEERLAKLVGGIAVIKVWASTKMELKNKKFKIEDAIMASKAAIAEWVTLWGGVELMTLAQHLPDFADKDENIWVSILRKACEIPLTLICNNAGYKWDYASERIKTWSLTEDNYGFDAKNGLFGDMFKMAIVDPVKVLRVSLQNAISMAICFLTSESIIYEEKTTKGQDD